MCALESPLGSGFPRMPVTTEHRRGCLFARHEVLSIVSVPLQSFVPSLQRACILHLRFTGFN